MEAVIQGTVNALGFLENGVYHQEPDCYESLRDIIRFLRNDTAEHLARRICGDHNILENDLIPILIQAAEGNDERMFDITLRLMINLAQPAIVSFQGKAPEDVQQWQFFAQLEANLQRAKLAFAHVHFFAILGDKLRTYFQQTEPDDQTEEQRMVMERIIILIRYIFSIGQSHIDGKRTVNDVNSTDRVINAFLDSNIHEIFIHVASQTKERDFHLAILEIFSLIIKEYKPSDLITTNPELALKEKTENEVALRQAFEVEEVKKAAKRWSMGMRHSRFSGTYVTKSPASSSSSNANNMVIMKPIKSANDLSFLDERKTKKRVARNRRPFEVTQKVHTSSVELRMKLKAFVELILEKAFNRLIKTTRDLAFGAKRAVGQRNSDMHYYLFMRFCLEYCRLAELNSNLVDNCIGTEAFHQAQVQLADNFELALTMKQEAKFYGMRAQYALSAYKELLLYHQHLLEKGNAEDRRLASTAVSHIQNVEEYREMASDIMGKFMPGAFSKNFLRELILSNHYYLRLLERSVKTGRLTTVKRRERIKKKPKRKPKAIKSAKEGANSITAKVDKLGKEKLEELWTGAVSESLNEVVSGQVDHSTDQVVLNALLEVEDDEHQRFAMLKIQRALRENRSADAVGLYRSSREIWNTDGVFGKEGMSVEEEINELREIFNADLGEVAKSFKKAMDAMEAQYEKAVEEENKENEEGAEMADNWLDGEAEGYEEEEDEPKYETKEVSFDIKEHIFKYARDNILKWYIYLLDEFDRNSLELNKALVKMLHRIAYDLNQPIRLYQISLFRVFYKVSEHFAPIRPEEKKKSSLYELYEFGYHLLKGFFKKYDALGGDRLAPEVLFWKDAKDAYEVEYGADAENDVSQANKIRADMLDEEENAEVGDSGKKKKGGKRGGSRKRKEPTTLPEDELNALLKDVQNEGQEGGKKKKKTRHSKTKKKRDILDDGWLQSDNESLGSERSEKETEEVDAEKDLDWDEWDNANALNIDEELGLGEIGEIAERPISRSIARTKSRSKTPAEKDDEEVVTTMPATKKRKIVIDSDEDEEDSDLRDLRLDSSLSDDDNDHDASKTGGEKGEEKRNTEVIPLNVDADKENTMAVDGEEEVEIIKHPTANNKALTLDSDEDEAEDSFHTARKRRTVIISDDED